MSAPKSRLIRAQKDHGPYTWPEVECEAYKQGQEAGREWKSIIRQVLVGKRAEETGFHLRYFEIEPGGYSSLEKHAHAHVVIAVRGQGRVILNDQASEMQALDTVYVAPWTPHQFLAGDDGPLWFFLHRRCRARPSPGRLSAGRPARPSRGCTVRHSRLSPPGRYGLPACTGLCLPSCTRPGHVRHHSWSLRCLSQKH